MGTRARLSFQAVKGVKHFCCPLKRFPSKEVSVTLITRFPGYLEIFKHYLEA